MVSRGRAIKLSYATFSVLDNPDLKLMFMRTSRLLGGEWVELGQAFYVRDPSDLLVEFTVDPPNADEIDNVQRASAHEEMRRWINGGRESNNHWRTAEETEAPTD